jgi:hypothetical protein
MSDKAIQFFKYLWHSREALIWIAAIAVMATIDPAGPHHSLCPFHNLGLTICPGCGLGRSVALLFRGEFIESFRMHPMGGIAVLLLAYRSITILIRNYPTKKPNKIFNYG